ncbi:MAG: phosphatidylserine decarboxylase [Campylobacterales bacterium]
MTGKTTTQIVATEGWGILIALAIAVVVALAAGWYRLAFLFVLTGAAAAYFFRNPERIPQEQDAFTIIAPADGKIEEIALREEGVSVRILNAPLDTHLLRMPLQGRIEQVRRKGGLAAVFGSPLDRLSQRDHLLIRPASGMEAVELILSPEVATPVLYGAGDRFYLGQRLGFFHGGRITLLLPAEVELRLAVGDRVNAGESVIGFARMNG